jgi:hypothetical protein
MNLAKSARVVVIGDQHCPHKNPYLGTADLASIYASQQWVGGWKAADGDRRVRSKIREASQEIADEIKRSADEACQKD